jgi:hypothetical protein
MTPCIGPSARSIQFLSSVAFLLLYFPSLYIAPARAFARYSVPECSPSHQPQQIRLMCLSLSFPQLLTVAFPCPARRLVSGAQSSLLSICRGNLIWSPYVHRPLATSYLITVDTVQSVCTCFC